jgi:hypothetical protein
MFRGRPPVAGSQKYIEKFGINSSGDPKKDVPIAKNIAIKVKKTLANNNKKLSAAKNIKIKAKKTLANNNKKEAPVSIKIIGDSNDVMPSTSNVSSKRKRSNDDEDDEDYEIDEKVCKI